MAVSIYPHLASKNLGLKGKTTSLLAQKVSKQLHELDENRGIESIFRSGTARERAEAQVLINKISICMIETLDEIDKVILIFNKRRKFCRDSKSLAEFACERRLEILESHPDELSVSDHQNSSHR